MKAYLGSLNRYLKAGIANILLLVAQTLLFLILTPLLLRNMGDEIYGIWTIMLTVVGFATLVNFGAEATVMKYTAQFIGSDDVSENFSAVFTFNYAAMLLIGLSAFAGVLLLRSLLVDNIDIGSVDPHSFRQALTIIGLSLIPLFLSLVSRGILLGLVRNEVANSISFFSVSILWLGALIVSLLAYDIVALAYWLLISHMIRFLLMSFFVWRDIIALKIKIRILWNAKLAIEMLHYSFAIWLRSIGVTIFKTFDRLLLAVTLDVAQVGVYSIGTSIAIRLNSLANQLAQLLIPYTSSRNAEGSENQIVIAFRFSSRVIGALLATVVCILLIWMNYILSLWISPEFASNYANVFRAFILAYGIYSMYLPAYNILAGRGWLRIPVIIQLSAGLLTIFFIWRLSISFGLIGAAYANFAYTIVLFMHFYLAKRIIKKPVVSMLSDLGPFFLIMTIVFGLTMADLSFLWQLMISLIAIIISSIFGLRNGGYQLIVAIFNKRNSSPYRLVRG